MNDYERPQWTDYFDNDREANTGTDRLGYRVTDVPHLSNETLGEIVTNDADHSSVRFAAMTEIKRRRPAPGENCLFWGTGDKPCRRCMDCSDHYS